MCIINILSNHCIVKARLLAEEIDAIGKRNYNRVEDWYSSDSETNYYNIHSTNTFLELRWFILQQFNRPHTSKTAWQWCRLVW